MHSQSQSHGSSHSSGSPVERRNNEQQTGIFGGLFGFVSGSLFSSESARNSNEHQALGAPLSLSGSSSFSSNSLWGNSSSGQLPSNEDSQFLGLNRSNSGSQETYYTYEGSQYSPYNESLPRMSLSSQSSSGSGRHFQRQVQAYDNSYILENQFLPSSNESGGCKEPASKRGRFD